MKEFDLEPGERVIRETRKHWFIFFLGLLPYAILAAIPYALPNLVTLMPVSFEISPDAARVLTGIWLLLVWTGAWGFFTRYYLNVWVLTTERIVAIKQRHYFNREVSSVLLNRVQDVTSEVRGVLSSLLGIGRITVQSAGSEQEFHMYGIPEPEVMRDLILKHVSAEIDQARV